MDRDEPTLFSITPSYGTVGDAPLPQRRRPKKTTDIVGQEHILNDRFRNILKSDRWSGFIFWGPPGTGKTSLAWIIAGETGRPFHTISAVNTGVKEIREYLEKSYGDFKTGRKAHILFIDEFHRLNKAQQDVLLPYLEQGSIRFIGATTENPSFEVNSAVSSRSLIFRFNPLSLTELERVITNAVPADTQIETGVISRLAQVANGDARRALNLLENLLLSRDSTHPIGLADFEKLSHSQSLYYDKNADSHYDTISAFIKSIRGSDPHGAVYYLARMLEGGEDPVFIARRLIILASEDVGNADPNGLVIATTGMQAVHVIGMPEARIVLAQVVTYLACAPKSNRSYTAINSAQEIVQKTGNLAIPLHLRNGATELMKEWGYGNGYDYPHNHPDGWTKAHYLPETLQTTRIYEPSQRGKEAEFYKWMRERGQLSDK